MKQYLDLCSHIMAYGVDRPDRTGTGTRGIFGYQMRFDLDKGFPLLTTKKINIDNIIYELLWFLKGSTDTKYLVEHGVHIWDANADKDGNLGPVYGKSWRSFGSKPESIPQPKPKLKEGIEATYIGVANGSGKEGCLLKKTWEGMINRCYRKDYPEYYLYGGKGVHVCNEWLEYSKFEKDCENIIGWENKKNNPRKYVLDKDGIGNGFLYSPSTCQWITTSENQNLKNEYIYIVKKEGKEYTFTNPTEFCKQQKISDKNFSDLWTGSKNAHIRNGFEFVSKTLINKGIDQIANVIKSIKEDPYGRRHIVSAWDTTWIEYARLPPCHCFFQFYVVNGKLSCQMYQRSADTFLGVPYNIASYALLTMMIAQVCNLGLGELIITFGDVHIYNDHFDQIREQISREPRTLPTMWINRRVTDIDGFLHRDFDLINYDPHPAIKGKMSV